jgi:DNA/RNA-binding domain of Phe-tRNA-synthetase-like protein
MEIESGLLERYPRLAVYELRIGGIAVEKSSEALELFKKSKQEEIRKKVPSLDAVKDLPIIRAYRDFYWKVGIDPTKTRPAGEALLRKILGGRDLPNINTVVDSYNIASAETTVSIAAFDSGKISGDNLFMRTANTGEPFKGIGMQSEIALSGVEVVIEDSASRDLIAVYPYRDADKSKVTEETSEVLFMMCGVPGIQREALVAAGKLTSEYVTKFCTSK